MDIQKELVYDIWLGNVSGQEEENPFFTMKNVYVIHDFLAICFMLLTSKTILSLIFYFIKKTFIIS